MVEVTSDDDKLTGVKGKILPVPIEGKPIEILELAHE